MEIDAVPGRYGGSKNARFWTERRRCVVAKAEAIAIVWPASILVQRVSWKSGKSEVHGH